MCSQVSGGNERCKPGLVRASSCLTYLPSRSVPNFLFSLNQSSGRATVPEVTCGNMAQCWAWGYPGGIKGYWGKHLRSRCELQVPRWVLLPHLCVQEMDDGSSFEVLCRAVIFCVLQVLLLIQTVSFLLGSRKSN